MEALPEMPISWIWQVFRGASIACVIFKKSGGFMKLP
jgi:hypothetical protein